MKRLIAGILIGLSLSAAPSIADWAYGDMLILQQIRDTVIGINHNLTRLNLTLTKMHEAQVKANELQERLAPRQPAENPRQRS